MDFVDQLIWIYFAFFPYIMGFLLSIAMYAAIILIYKKQKNRKSPSAYIYSLSLYLGFIFLFANFPSFLNFGIITKNKVYLREFSSSAAPVRAWSEHASCERTLPEVEVQALQSTAAQSAAS